ncbi:MAG TPA: PAS domain S-box protein [Cytophagaceae bacterium]|jgi:PAS domain S-box-containing protein
MLKKLSLELPLLKQYAGFLKENLLHEFTREVLANYKALDVPLLKMFSHLSDEEVYTIARQSLSTLLEQFADGEGVEAAEMGIRNWKEDKIPGISRQEIKASDIVLINNARKSAFLKFLFEFILDKNDAYPLLKEIEDYYTFTGGLAIEAFAQIKQDEIAKREKILREAQALANVGNWEFNTITKEIKWSDELYRIYDIDPSRKLSSEEIIQHIHPEDFPGMQHSVRSSLQNLGSYRVEYRIKRSNGEIRTLLENGYSEEDGEGRRITRGTAQDITLVKKVENELRESEKNFRLLAENSTDIISRHGLDGTITYISPSCIPITGYSAEELLGRTAFDFYHPEDLAYMQHAYEEVALVPDSNIAVFRFRRKDGTYVWFESIGKTIKDQNGKPIEIIATNRDITERKKAEERLRNSEELLSGVLNSSLSGLQVFKAVKDENGVIIDFEWLLVNTSVLNLWGKTKEEVIGNRLHTLFPGVKPSGIFDKYVEAAQGKVLNFKQHYNAEGFNHWFHIVAVQYGDGFILSTDDITAEVKAEEELRKINIELEEKVKERTSQLEKQKEDIYSVFMQAPAMIAILRGPNYVFELANSLYLNVVGKTEDIIGKPLLEVLPEIEDQPIHHIINKVYQTGERFIGNEVLILLDTNGDGETENLYFNFVYEPLKNAEGEVDGFMTHAVEVTSQVLARMKLEESEDRFRSMADNIPNLAWMANPDGAVFWYNQRWYDYTGTNKEEMEGWGWQLVIHPEELLKVSERWIQSISTGDFFEMVIPIRGADGVFRPFLTRVKPIEDKEGKIIRWFGTNTDISEQVNSEQILERKNKELIHINNDLDNFIYTASHDLKSPVSNLEGLLNMVSDEDEGLLSERGKDVLPLVDQSLVRLKTVINELTEIAKIQKETDAVEEIINVEEFFKEVMFSLAREVYEYKGTVNNDFSGGAQIKFSRKNLRSIFFNLISNALKYSDPSKVGSVLVKTETEHDFLVLTIQDNGLGIPGNQLDKIFTMFKRYHTHVEGSGVGLYIVKRIIENAGGKIEVESQEGQGTTFRLTFRIF